MPGEQKVDKNGCLNHQNLRWIEIAGNFLNICEKKSINSRRACFSLPSFIIDYWLIKFINSLMIYWRRHSRSSGSRHWGKKRKPWNRQNSRRRNSWSWSSRRKRRPSWRRWKLTRHCWTRRRAKWRRIFRMNSPRNLWRKRRIWRGLRRRIARCWRIGWRYCKITFFREVFNFVNFERTNCQIKYCWNGSIFWNSKI